jgi:hypothetical protein
MVSSVNISPNTADDKPAARQLMYSLQRYMLSDKFNPSFTVGTDVVKNLFSKPSRRVFDAFTKDSPDELKPKPANQ